MASKMDRFEPRTTAITNDFWRLGKLCQWEDPLACWLRNTLMRLTLEAVSQRLIKNKVKFALPQLPNFSKGAL